MTQPYDTDDPFSGGIKSPSLSWKSLPIGSTFVLEVLEAPKLLQGRNFDTNEPDYWDAAKTQPKMSVVINVRVMSGPHSVGEQRSVWAQKPSNLFVAIAEAQRAAGVRIIAGGTLHLQFHGERQHEDKRKNPIKLYVAKYEPPKHDVFRDEFAPPASQAQAPSSYPRPVATASLADKTSW